MTHHHLRLVHDDPPDLDDGDGGGDDGEEMLAVDVTLAGGDSINGARVILPLTVSPEEIAHALVMTIRGVAATYDVDVQLALERRLLHWGDSSER